MKNDKYFKFFVFLLFIMSLSFDNALASPTCSQTFIESKSIDFANDILKNYGPPKGLLSEIANQQPHQARLVFVDEAGTEWEFKRDGSSKELQTAAEVISSSIYRHFKYAAPETYIVVKDGQRYSASRRLPTGQKIDSNAIENSSSFRALRLLASFLKDYERLKLGNIIKLSDGSYSFQNFQKTLGAGTQKESSQSQKVSEAVGSFSAPKLPYGLFPTLGTRDLDWGSDGHPLKLVYDSFRIENIKSKHPWQDVTADDALKIQESFRTLDTKTIIEIVKRAQYASYQDESCVVETLSTLRDIYLEYLADYLRGHTIANTQFYWGRQHPVPPLTFDVRDNRPEKISSDISAFVNNIIMPPKHILLFRGQEGFSSEVSSPLARKRAADGLKPLTKSEQNTYFENLLIYQKHLLNPMRRDARQILVIAPNAIAEVTWNDRATPADLLAKSHSTSNGDNFFVSATRSLGVAARWVEDSRFSTKYRYVYILIVPTEETFIISQALKDLPGSNDEAELTIKYDATKYVYAIYDTIEQKFISK